MLLCYFHLLSTCDIIIERVDTNEDGVIDTEEFADFLLHMGELEELYNHIPHLKQALMKTQDAFRIKSAGDQAWHLVPNWLDRNKSHLDTNKHHMMPILEGVYDIGNVLAVCKVLSWPVARSNAYAVTLSPFSLSQYTMGSFG